MFWSEAERSSVGCTERKPSVRIWILQNGTGPSRFFSFCHFRFCRLPAKDKQCSGVEMSIAELILEKTRRLPDELQQEALHYVDSLLARQAETKESRDWSRFSTQQLARQYAPADAIYDQD